MKIYSRQIVWFVVIVFVGLMANTGADTLFELGINVNKKITCNVAHFSSKPLDLDDRVFQLLKSKKMSNRRVTIQREYKDSIKLRMDCRWENKYYICAWNNLNYLKLDTEKVWKSQVTDGGKSYVEVKGEWHQNSRKKPTLINCLQEVSKS